MKNTKRLKILCYTILWCGIFFTNALAELKVLAVSPTGATAGREASQIITATFNQPMVPLEKLKGNEADGILTINPQIIGKYRWQGTSVLTFIPEKQLPLATNFKVTLNRGITSVVTHDTMQESYSWNFETLRPNLQTSYPYENQGWIDLREKVCLLFNQAMDHKKAPYFIRFKERTADGKTTDLTFNVDFITAQDKELLKKEGYYQPYAILNSTPSYTLVIKPKELLKMGGSYFVQLSTGLPSAEGNLGLISQRVINFTTYNVFKFIRPASWDKLEPSRGIEFDFSNPIKYADFFKVLKIDPPVKLPELLVTSQQFTNGDTSRQLCPVYVNCGLLPNTRYKVTMQGILTDKFGQSLGRKLETYFQTTDFDPRMKMPTGMGIVESYLEPARHPLRLLNLDKVRLQMALIDESNIVKISSNTFIEEEYALTPPAGWQVDRLWDLNAPKNIGTTNPIELNEVMGNRKSAIVYLQVDALKDLGNGNRFRQALLQVTPLGITSKFSPDGNLVYVSRLKDSQPVTKCEVQLRNENNQLLWSGKTDAKGFVLTPGWEELKIVPVLRWNKPKLWVIAKDGENIAFIHSDWGTGIYPYNFNISYEWEPAYPKYAGHIYSDRGIYRPGETVYLKGIIRENRLGTWEIPRISDYTLFIKDSRNTEIIKVPIKISPYGSFDYTYSVDKNSPTGYYTVNLWQKGTEKKDNEEEYYWNDRKIRFSSSFRVEEFKPATFEVTINTDEGEYLLGDTATIKMNGRYLFGAPVAEGDLKYTISLFPGDFRPEGYSGYIFGGNNYWRREEGEFEYEHHSVNYVISSAKTNLDKNGDFSISIPLVYGGTGALSLAAEGNVTSPDRQQISGRKSAVVHGGEYYIGIKPSSFLIEKGKKQDIDLLTVTPDGKQVKDKELQFKITRIEWNSVQKSGVAGRLEWHSEKKEVEVYKNSGFSKNDPIIISYVPDKAGYYIFQAEGLDRRGHRIVSNFSFYVSGTDYSAWERGTDDRIELICDKEKYKPGETAKIMVKSPYEEAWAVITLEREGIIDHWRSKITGSADTLFIPIKEDYLPNVFVCVMLYHGRDKIKISDDNEDDLGKPSFKIGYMNLPVDPGTKHLDITVEPDKNEYRPNDQVTVKLKVKDTDKKGVPAEVNVAVVDAGILNLINYQTPNSFPYFYGPRSLSVETAETRLHILGQRNYGEKGENRGGGGGMFADIDVRTKFIPTAYWNPSIMTKNDGTAEFAFTLPENLSTFRIMASAQTKDSCFGAGDNRIKVNKPLILKPSLPRFAILGDTFTAGVLCHNNTANDGKVTIKVETKGIEINGLKMKTVQIGKGEAKEITFDFVAAEAGTAELVFLAKMADETDGLAWSIPVSVPRPTEAVATYNSTIDSTQEGIKIPGNIYEDSSSISLSLASTALIGVKGGLEYLFEYPYGCLEQKTSKIAPLILAGDFIDMFNLAPLKQNTARELITGYLNELPQFQTPSGGFSFWKNGLESPYLTAYVIWLVGEAKAKGFAVNEAIKEKALNFMVSYLHGDKAGWEWPYSINAQLTTKALIAYALSINGRHEQPYINNLYQKVDQMSLFGKVYLLKAITIEKMNPVMSGTIIQELNNKIKVEPTKAHFEESAENGMEWIWNSNVRTTAIILQTLLETRGQYPNAEKIARWLASERKSGRWMNTQDNMYVFYAFAQYVNTYEKETPDFSATVLLDSKEIMNELFKGRTLKAKTKNLSVSGYQHDLMLPIVLNKTGTGRLYYELRMTYAPKGDLDPMERGIFIEKSIKPLDKSADTLNSTGNYNLGQKYIVTLKVKTDQERQFVALNDPLPAGFEVVNLSFATESRAEGREFYAGAENRNYTWWGSFDHWENYDDKVLLFADYLLTGEHTYSYLIQATIPGNFLLPAAKIEEMYTPEVFGRTGQKRITIK